MSRIKGMWYLWMLLTLATLLGMTVLTPMVINEAAASPGTKFAVEYKYNWPASGSTFKVNVTVYEADYLYSWQVYMNWSSTYLQVTNVVFGGFLASQPEGSTTNVRVEAGWLIVGEATQGAYVGKSAAQGLLVTITFLVKTAGHTTIFINHPTLTYYMYCLTPPTLVKKYPTRSDGYMSTLIGDADCDGDVDNADIIVLNGGYGAHAPEGDFDHSGNTDVKDLYTLGKNY